LLPVLLVAATVMPTSFSLDSTRRDNARVVARDYNDPRQTRHAERIALSCDLLPVDQIGSKKRRKEIAEDLASQIIDSRDFDRCVMIWRNTSCWNEPYASVLIFSHGKDGSGFGSII
jgi:hypothetical protein